MCSGINGWCPLATGFASSSCCCDREKRDVCSVGVNRFVTDGGGAVNNFCGAGKSSFVRWGCSVGTLNKTIRRWRWSLNQLAYSTDRTGGGGGI